MLIGITKENSLIKLKLKLFENIFNYTVWRILNLIKLKLFNVYIIYTISLITFIAYFRISLLLKYSAIKMSAQCQWKSIYIKPSVFQLISIQNKVLYMIIKVFCRYISVVESNDPFSCIHHWLPVFLSNNFLLVWIFRKIRKGI